MYHDLKHFATLINEAASIGDTDKIKEYVNALTKRSSEGLAKKYCENITVNLILSSLVIGSAFQVLFLQKPHRPY